MYGDINKNHSDYFNYATGLEREKRKTGFLIPHDNFKWASRSSATGTGHLHSVYGSFEHRKSYTELPDSQKNKGHQKGLSLISEDQEDHKVSSSLPLSHIGNDIYYMTNPSNLPATLKWECVKICKAGRCARQIRWKHGSSKQSVSLRVYLLFQGSNIHKQNPLEQDVFDMVESDN